MELAFLPIAAVLLLLSGASAPAHALRERSSTVALMRHFLGTSGPAAEFLASPRATRRAQINGQRITGHQAGLDRGFIPFRTPPQLPAQAALASGTRLRGKQYRTRFGFADGAYLATAPPLA